MTPELKNYYSVKLLERLVPALQNAAEPIDPSTLSEENRDMFEMMEAVTKWSRWFDKRDPITGLWNNADHGFYHVIINS
jgi:hypothetical protein